MTSRNRSESNVEDAELKRVEVDALVILQIMKHCRQQALHSPSPVTGVLLGLDVNDSLQVTHCFGNPLKSSDQDQAHVDDGEAYQLDMLKGLRAVNVDSNTVGWYQSTSLGNFFNDTLIETQYRYQEEIPGSIILVYDQFQSQIGKPSFKALRLTTAFMEKYKEFKDSNTKSALNEFPSNSMFVEIPITVTSGVIAEAFLVDWAIADPSSCTQIETLDVENQLQERNVQLLINSLQDLAEEQQKMQQYERQASRNQDQKGQGKGRQYRAQPPRQLDTMILSQQIQNYCKQINNSASDTFGKVFLLANKPASAAAAA